MSGVQDSYGRDELLSVFMQEQVGTLLCAEVVSKGVPQNKHSVSLLK